MPWVVADFDCAIAPGDHRLSVKRGPSETDQDSASLTIGAVGPQGPRGEPGESGVARYEIVRWSVFEPSSREEQRGSCPAGMRVISGGWNIVGRPDLTVNVGDSYALDETTWVFRVGARDDAVVEFGIICVGE